MSDLWSDEYAVNVAILDEQHVALSILVNRLLLLVETQAEEAQLRTVLDELIVAVRTHFATEEELMQRHGYGGYSAHRDIHETLLSQVSELAKELPQGQQAADLGTFLKAWLFDHIRGSDRYLGYYLNLQGVH